MGIRAFTVATAKNSFQLFEIIPHRVSSKQAHRRLHICARFLGGTAFVYTRRKRFRPRHRRKAKQTRDENWSPPTLVPTLSRLAMRETIARETSRLAGVGRPRSPGTLHARTANEIVCAECTNAKEAAEGN